MNTPLLAIDSVTKSFGAHQALRGVSFTVQEGELFGLLGPNGAGKTTLLSIVSCLMDATSGGANLLGRPLNASDRQVRRLIGLVPQELAIYNELTARENLRFFGELYAVKSPVLQQRVEATLDAIGLADRADERVGGFSGGMKRRLNFGVALIHQPRLLLLDEPTTGVDPQSRNHIFEEVRRLNRAGMTIIYTSHYMEEVEALCTRIGIIDHGQLIACDSLTGLLQRLSGMIRIRLAHPVTGLLERLARMQGVRLHERDGLELGIEAADVKPVLGQLMGLMAELGVDLTSLEIQEPNLERVFLHLTGRGLRD
ncbi:MAG TPA: ABC transporter ATP-binding protein [Gemmataceae bacterium]|nr:ABC transporter ATP-binding protein [Gemmataceae bacterium]